MTIFTDPLYREAHDALHALWTKALRDETYSKDEWRRLDLAIDALAKRSRELANRDGVGIAPDGCPGYVTSLHDEKETCLNCGGPRHL